MTNLTSQRRLAARIMKCGVNRVYISDDDATTRRVSMALTREEISKLINSGTIKKRTIQGTSRRKARARHHKIQRGQRRGVGSRKGTKNARTNQKSVWINKIRGQRKYLRKLRDEGYITPRNYRILYRQAKGNLFRSLRYLHNYIQERGYAEKKIPAPRRN